MWQSPKRWVALFAVASFVAQEDTDVGMTVRGALKNCMPDLHNPIKKWGELSQEASCSEKQAVRTTTFFFLSDFIEVLTPETLCQDTHSKCPLGI